MTKKRKDIPCEWSFEENRCYYSGEEFVTIRAKCKLCSAYLCGVIEKEPTENEPVNLMFEVRGLNEKKHEKAEPKKVRIGGEYAKSVYETNKKPSAVRRDIMRKKGELFKKPYGRVPTANAIRCGKYRLRQKEKLSDDPYKALQYLKASTKYMDTIQFIGQDFFSCIYSSPAQLKMYKAYKRKNRFTIITCDSSGGVVHKLGKIVVSNIFTTKATKKLKL